MVRVFYYNIKHEDSLNYNTPFPVTLFKDLMKACLYQVQWGNGIYTITNSLVTSCMLYFLHITCKFKITRINFAS